MKTVKFETEGMHCASCEMVIEMALEELDGVEKIEVNSAGNRVSVTYDDSKITDASISKTIEDAGYSIKTTEIIN